MSDANDMIILTRTYTLLKWLIPKQQYFAKLYRSTVTQRLMDAALDFQEAILEANVYDGKLRLRHLKQADADLSKLRLYLRLIHDWQWISTGQYEHVSEQVAEIGRLLGGWIKQTETNKK